MDKDVIKIIASAIVNVIAIASLTLYGLKLAELGIDSSVAMTIGGIIGGVAGYNAKELFSILKSK